jgi:4-diphosphocytidyl-2-C-methyl-D-erythritol kinase
LRRADSLALAKVNLALHVTGQRDDGYHDIDTIVMFAEMADYVSVRRFGFETFDVTGPYKQQVPGYDGGNLVIRARDAFRAAFPDCATPVMLTLDKNIPVSAGVGGGSCDAAATLRAMADVFDIPAASPRLMDVARSLGADVPMCLMSRPLRARGIGHDLTPLDGMPTLPMVLVNPGIAVSTPDVFRALEHRRNPGIGAMALPNTRTELLAWIGGLRNDLQPAAIGLVPEIATALAALDDSGAQLARMSGSGATCFGVHATLDDAKQAAQEIAQNNRDWMVAWTVLRGSSGKESH